MPRLRIRLRYTRINQSTVRFEAPPAVMEERYYALSQDMFGSGPCRIACLRIVTHTMFTNCSWDMQVMQESTVGATMRGTKLRSSKAPAVPLPPMITRTTIGRRPGHPTIPHASSRPKLFHRAGAQPHTVGCIHAYTYIHIYIYTYA